MEKGQATAEHLQGTKEQSHVLATALRLASKVDKCHFSVVYQSLVNSPNRVEYKGVNLDTLQALVEKLGKEVILPQDIIENGLAGKHDLIKILGRGELKAKVEVSAHKFSKSAQAAIEAAGGSVQTIDRLAK